MQATYKIEQVSGPSPWSNDRGTFHEYRLRLNGVEKPVSVNYKPDSPKPVEGQDILLEIAPHPRFNDILKGKRVQPARNQQGSFTSNGSGHDDVTRRSIEAQVALKAAVEYETHKDTLAAAHNGALGSSMDVTVTAGVFLEWLRGQS